MISLTGLRSVGRILAEYPCALAASILVHCRGAGPIVGHDLLVQVVVRGGRLTLESVMLALCDLRGLKAAVGGRGCD